MTIRRLLLIAFLGLTFLASAILAALSFVAAREALAAEIGRNLAEDANMLMEQVDEWLFERLQNVHSWSHLDIMQEARVGDVDKRLARFLADIRLGYGDTYRELFYIDGTHRILASSNSGGIGRTYSPEPAWAEASVPQGEVFLEALRLIPPYTGAELMIRAPVDDPYAGGEMGQLYGALNLAGIFRLFDQAEGSPSDQRSVALMDREGRMIAASITLRQKALLLDKGFAAWRSGNGIQVRNGAPAVDGEVLVGVAVSRGYQGYPGLGWSLLVFQPVWEAFRPIHRLLWMFGVAFLGTGLLAGTAAHRVAGRIARPLMALTAWAREFARSESRSHPAIAGTREVRKLGEAFGQMVEDLERSRQQVIHAAKLAVVGEMAAIMAHEVRTPLGILHTSAQMLQREPQLSQEGQELARFILEESSRLGRLISTLLECARPRAPEMQRQDVHAILRRAADLLAGQARKKNLRIEWRLQAFDSVIPCDEELLMQVFLNLILNAIQILPVESRIALRSQASDEDLMISVEDDGPGIPPERRPLVFDPFYTTRENGIGLGLTVTRQIIIAHGGRIEVDRSAWGGARFRVILPRRRKIPQETAAFTVRETPR